MRDRLRIATWNLDHASKSSRPIDLQIDQIRRIKPDILILTETCEEVDLSPQGFICFSSAKNEYGKFYSAIHLGPRVKFAEQLATYEESTAVCVKVDSPLGGMIVYGTVIAYGGYKGLDKDAPAPAWAEHYRAIREQGEDWAKLLRESEGKLPLVVAGDFNQTRDGSSGTYGTKAGRELLTEALERNHLACLTTENFGAEGKLRVDPGKGWARSNVDHICVTAGAFSVIEVGAWDHFTDAGKYLSDHNGVYADIEARTSSRPLPAHESSIAPRHSGERR